MGREEILMKIDAFTRTEASTPHPPAQPSYNLWFPGLYGLIILAGTLDLWLTGILLAFNGEETNPLAK
jgi:hypothetical protein